MPGEGAQRRVWYCDPRSGQCRNLYPDEISSGRYSGWNEVGTKQQAEWWKERWDVVQGSPDVDEDEVDIPAAAEDVAEGALDLTEDAVTTGGEVAEVAYPGLLDYWESLYGEYAPVYADPSTTVSQVNFDAEGNIVDEAGNIMYTADYFSYDAEGNIINNQGNIMYTADDTIIDYELVGEPGWLQQQIDYAQEQAGLQEELLPLQLEALGYMYNDEGELVRIPPTPYEAALEERRLAGMGFKEVDGELVELTDAELDEMVSPGLKSEIDRQQKLMVERLSRKGITPGTTAYAQAMSTFDERIISLKQQERQSWLTEGQGLLGAETARLMATTQTELGNIGGLGTSVAAPPMPFSPYQGLLGTVAAGMQPYQYQQGLEYGILPTQMNLAAGGQGPGIGQMIGMAGGGALGWYATGGNPYGAMFGAGLGSQVGNWWDTV